jgi:hypothetical protein
MPNYTVTFVDYNAAVLKTQVVSSGSSATPPSAPYHMNMTFDGWIGDYTNISGNVTVIASYTTIDDKLYSSISLTASTGLSPTFYIHNDGLANSVVINYGDGISVTSSGIGDLSFNHTYSHYGNYVISISGTNFYLGNSTPTSFLTGNYAAASTRCYNSPTSSITNTISFFNSSNISSVLLNGGTSIGVASMLGCTSLRSIVIPSTIESIGDSAFAGCINLKAYILLDATPPILSNSNAFAGIPSDAKIYVPDSAVNAYKVAANWSDYSSKIFGIGSIVYPEIPTGIPQSDINFYNASNHLITSGIGGQQSTSLYPKITSFTEDLTTASKLIKLPYTGRVSISGNKWFTSSSLGVSHTVSLPGVVCDVDGIASAKWGNGSFIYTSDNKTVTLPYGVGACVFTTYGNTRFFKVDTSSFVESISGSVLSKPIITINGVQVNSGNIEEITNDTGRVVRYTISVSFNSNENLTIIERDHGSIRFYGDQTTCNTLLASINIKKSPQAITLYPTTVTPDGDFGRWGPVLLKTSKSWSLIPV